MNQIKLSTAIQDFIVKWQPLSMGRPDLEDLVGAMKALYTACKYHEDNGVSPVEYSDALTLLSKMTAECKKLRELETFLKGNSDRIQQEMIERLNAANERIRQLEAQSVPVLGPPVAWVNINKHGDATRTVSRRDNWCTTPVFAKPKTSILAADLARLLEKAAEADELRKAAELGECIRVKFRLMKGSTAVRFLGCLGVNEPEGGFDWSKTVLELIDAAIAQGKGE